MAYHPVMPFARLILPMLAAMAASSLAGQSHTISYARIRLGP